MLRYCWVLPLSNEPKHIYVGPAVTEPFDFLSRTVEFLRYLALQPSSVRREGYTERKPTTVKAGEILRCYVLPVLFSLHITCYKRSRNIIGQLSKKKQYITPLPHPLPSF